VDEARVTELETAIADTGALLVRLQKYARAARPEALALGREAMALGDAARRLHRRGQLDDHAVTTLLHEARGLAARLRTFLADVRTTPEYQAAVAAHVAGDQRTLARVAPAVFAGLEVTDAATLFVPVAWVRRGRVRPVADVVADVVHARDDGLAPEGDDLTPGADDALPAVVFAAEPPADEPVLLRVATAALPTVFRLTDTGEHVVYARCVPLRNLTVTLATELGEDEQRRVEIRPADWTRWRAALAAALAAASVPVDDA
jgi:hypothetical protein